MGENPWWHPSEDDLDWDEPLPGVILSGSITRSRLAGAWPVLWAGIIPE